MCILVYCNIFFLYLFQCYYIHYMLLEPCARVSCWKWVIDMRTKLDILFDVLPLRGKLLTKLFWQISWSRLICDILLQKARKWKKEYKTKNRGNAEHCCGVIACIAASKKKKYISDDLCNAKQIALNFSILFLKH